MSETLSALITAGVLEDGYSVWPLYAADA